jgi:asparagine synthase (glutamine-hydrolysing)
MMESLTASPLLRAAFNMTTIQKLVRAHEEYRANHSHILWALINLAVWHRLFVEAPPQPGPMEHARGPRAPLAKV